MGKKPAGEKDRLAEAILSKEEKITLEEKELTLKKWGLKLSFKLTGRFTSIFSSVMKLLGDGKVSGSTDIGEVIASQYEPVREILVQTLRAGGNFSNDEECEAWLEDAGIDAAIELLQVIARQNFRPLAESLSKVSSVLGTVGGVNAMLRGARAPSMQSPSSSGQASTTEPSQKSGA